MKKYLLLLSLMALAFTSCEGPVGPPGRDFAPYVEYIKVKPQDWEYLGANDYVSFYQYIVDIKIGSDTYDKGIVDVYLYQTEGDNEVQAKLPQWVQYSDKGNTWVEGYDFNFDKNTIAFFAECKKGLLPPASEFRVVLAP